MLVYILRHGLATPREEAAGILDDRDRELTAEGWKKTRQCARGMRELGLEASLILTSPYIRTRQTADIVARELKVPPEAVRECTLLEPGASPAELVQELSALDPSSSVIVVGHEPGLSSLASLLLAGEAGAVRMELKKAALCAIECGMLLSGERGILRFLLQPAHLRSRA